MKAGPETATAANAGGYRLLAQPAVFPEASFDKLRFHVGWIASETLAE